MPDTWPAAAARTYFRTYPFTVKRNQPSLHAQLAATGDMRRVEMRASDAAAVR